MIAYLDSSALVKLYVQEPGSPEVRALINEARIVATSRVAYVEARAGFTRKLREGELLQEEYNQVVEDFKEGWEKYFARNRRPSGRVDHALMILRRFNGKADREKALREFPLDRMLQETGRVYEEVLEDTRT